MGIGVVQFCFPIRNFYYLKQYIRTGDRECPMSKSGNDRIDSQRQVREDPMSRFVSKESKRRQEKYEWVEQLKVLMEQIRQEEKERKLKKELKKKKKSKKRKRDSAEYK